MNGEVYVMKAVKAPYGRMKTLHDSLQYPLRVKRFSSKTFRQVTSL